MKKLAIVAALALAGPAFAQDRDSEARNTFLAWKLLDEPAVDPWDKYPKASVSKTAVWSAENILGEVFWIDKSDLKFDGNLVSFWMNGYHLANRNVSYRRSLWKMTVLCSGSMKVEAYSKYAADGTVVEEKDYHSPPFTAIRPGTMYATIVETFCP